MISHSVWAGGIDHAAVSSNPSWMANYKFLLKNDEIMLAAIKTLS